MVRSLCDVGETKKKKKKEIPLQGIKYRKALYNVNYNINNFTLLLAMHGIYSLHSFRSINIFLDNSKVATSASRVFLCEYKSQQTDNQSNPEPKEKSGQTNLLGVGNANIFWDSSHIVRLLLILDNLVEIQLSEVQFSIELSNLDVKINKPL